ncbi:hypothetical protein BDW22DRAFT_1357957, partial [Trametopsis cervina]
MSSLTIKHFYSDKDKDDDDEYAINIGQQLLKQACGQNGWVNVAAPSASQLADFKISNRVYQYALAVPRVDAIWHTSDIAKFNPHTTVAEEAIKIDDLEDFDHGPDVGSLEGDRSMDDLLRSIRFLHQSFLVDHQPEAESTHFFHRPTQDTSDSILAEISGLDLSFYGEEDHSIATRLEAARHAQALLQGSLPAPSSTGDQYRSAGLTHSTESGNYIDRNHSAYNPSSGWSGQYDIRRSSERNTHTSHASSKEMGAPITVLPPETDDASSGKPLQYNEPAPGIPGLPSSASVPSPPLTQPRRVSPDPSPHIHHPAPSFHIPSWQINDDMTNLYTQDQSLLPPAEIYASGSSMDLGTADFPVDDTHELIQDPYPWLSQGSLESDFPERRSLSRSPQSQPSAYRTFDEEPMQYLSQSTQASLASQPSAYRAVSPPMTRILPQSFELYRMPRRVSPSPSPPPSAHIPGLQAKDPYDRDAFDSFEIPGLNAPPPPSVQGGKALTPIGEAHDPSIPMSSPIQDFTTIHEAPPSASTSNRPRSVVGPRWKFPERRAAGKSQRTQDRKDAPPSSPIQEFTSWDIGTQGGDPPGLNAGREHNLEPQLNLIPEEVTKDILDDTFEETEDPRESRERSYEVWKAQHAAEDLDDDSTDLYGGVGQNAPSASGSSKKSSNRSLGGLPQKLSRMSTEEQLYGPTDKDKSLGGLPQKLSRMSTEEQLYGTSEKEKSTTSVGGPSNKPPMSRAMGVRTPEPRPFEGAAGSSTIPGAGKHARSPSAALSREQSRTDVLAAEGRILNPPRKRRRIDSKSLYHLIPEPHIYAVQIDPHQPQPPPLPELPNTKFYTVQSEPTFLPTFPFRPFADPFAAYFQDPHARCAWIVPVRGTPPFPDCTSASVLEPNPLAGPQWALPSGPASHGAHQDSPGSITWTEEVLRAFWDFLISVREARTMGDIGLAFVCANASSGSSTRRQVASSSSDHPRDGWDFDYVEVNLGAPHARKMRDVLHVWYFECMLPEQLGGQLGRYRLLKGAKLVLLDERDRGILTW